MPVAIFVAMKRGSWAQSPSTLYEASDQGVITRSTLSALGVANGTVSARCRPGGHWQHFLPGVVLLNNGHPTQAQRLAGALAYGGNNAVVTGMAALQLHGVTSGTHSSDVHILVPQRERRTSTSFVRVERTWRTPDRIRRGSSVYASVTRSLVDATRSIRDQSRCTTLMAEAVRRGSTTLEEIAAEVADGPRRYSATSRAAWLELHDGAHSAAEAQAHRLYARSGLPPMVHNRTIVDSLGAFIACPDGWIDEVAFAWEIDSLAHHLSPTDHAGTMARLTRMRNQGLIVVSHLPSMIRDRPEQVVDDLRTHYALAKARPRPGECPINGGSNLGVG